MKRINALCQIFLIVLILPLTGYVNAQEDNPCKTNGQTSYFAVEINGVLCGYSVETSCEGILDGKTVHYENSDITVKMTLLGANVDLGIQTLYGFDPVIGRTILINYAYSTGQSKLHSETKISNDTAYFTNSSSGVKKAVPLSKDAIILSQTKYPHLLEDFSGTGITEKTYTVYDPFSGELIEKSYIKKGEENVRLIDSVFHTTVFEETDLSNGIKTTLWLVKEDGFIVKALVAGRNIYLTDKTVTGKIQMADMNNVIIARVNKIIPDFMDMTWLKVKAQINSYGEKITPESLNFPGQKFTGTVTGSMIDGIFEIESRRYNGANAPPFPPNYSKIPDLRKYLEPEMMIESDDPLIIAEAKRITAGSGDSWEAAVRLSKWVAENIAGALPGGQTAINTLKIREAECGGHSRLLAALCRAVGIPARLSIGCMYITYYTGSFGQHAWTEIYMGDAGWIPVDATIKEVDYVDAGHIRLGDNATFQPESMEILDYSIGAGTTNKKETTGPEAGRQLTDNYSDK